MPIILLKKSQFRPDGGGTAFDKTPKDKREVENYFFAAFVLYSQSPKDS